MFLILPNAHWLPHEEPSVAIALQSFVASLSFSFLRFSALCLF
jgi:hypothetical protein